MFHIQYRSFETKNKEFFKIGIFGVHLDLADFQWLLGQDADGQLIDSSTMMFVGDDDGRRWRSGRHLHRPIIGHVDLPVVVSDGKRLLMSNSKSISSGSN